MFPWRPVDLRRAWEYWRRYATIVWMTPKPDGKNGGFVLYRLNDDSEPPSRSIPFLPGAEGAGTYTGGDYAEFTERLETVNDCAPGITFFQARLAMGLLKVGRNGEALDFASRGLDTVYPEKDVLYGLCGTALMRMKRYRKAIESFRKAESLNQTEPAYRRFREVCEKAMDERRK